MKDNKVILEHLRSEMQDHFDQKINHLVEFFSREKEEREKMMEDFKILNSLKEKQNEVFFKLGLI